MTTVFSRTALGGTFDHLHSGHKILLAIAAFLTTSELVVGVMDPERERLERKKYYKEMEHISIRTQKVKDFLGTISRNLKVSAVEIQDDYGPTKTDAGLQALIGSAETAKGCLLGTIYLS